MGKACALVNISKIQKIFNKCKKKDIVWWSIFVYTERNWLICLKIYKQTSSFLGLQQNARAKSRWVNLETGLPPVVGKK